MRSDWMGRHRGSTMNSGGPSTAVNGPRTRWRPLHFALAVTVAVSILSPANPVEAASSGRTSLTIQVLSNRADLLSGGDALVEIRLPSGTNPSDVRVELNGSDITAAFGVRESGRYVGLVTGLRLGENALTASSSRSSHAALTLTNHPIGGPVFSGRQIEPWICETDASGLGTPQDDQCNAPAQVDLLYKSTNPLVTGFQSYDRDNPPSDVAMTTTDEGKTVPFIVLRETGTMNRGIYRTWVLYDPESSGDLRAKTASWNRKLYYMFGGGASPQQRQGSALDYSNTSTGEYALGRGWALATNSLNRLAQNTNSVTSAEAVMMLKERVIEQYGSIRYTVGVGCSGGGLQQYLIAGAYPGLLDGIQPACSPMDVLTTTNEILDCSLLERYYNQTSPHLWLIGEQRSAVNGHQNPGTCVVWGDSGEARGLSDPRVGCMTGPFHVGPVGANSDTGIEPDWVYHPEENPTGARCTIQDNQVAVYGRRPVDTWGDVEQNISRGFANRAFDNTGIQYGLNALQSGEITFDQFLDLNEKIGGYDIDMDWQPSRTSADPFALDAAYRSGQVTYGEQLASVPIIDLRSHESYGVHPDFHSWVIRARLDDANGHHDNQLIWVSNPGQSVPHEDAFRLMDEWLTAIEADGSHAPLEEKVVRHKPIGAVDSCWVSTRQITDRARCRALYPYFGSPRIAAGEPTAENVLKCRLRPLDRGEYNATFTDFEWQRLQEVFPEGVCDYRVPGVSQQPAIPWLTFAAGPGGQLLGGVPQSQVHPGPVPKSDGEDASSGEDEDALGSASGGSGAQPGVLPATGGGGRWLHGFVLILAAAMLARARNAQGPASLQLRP